jgi:sugar phosphate isomerase/epimerase
MDILLAETDPELVAIEIDVGWVAAAGVDPAALMAAHPGRFKLMHVKDLKASTTPNVSLRMDPTEVGSGAIDWPRVMAAAHAAGVRDFYIEQEPPFAMEQLEAAAVGWRFLSALEA